MIAPRKIKFEAKKKRDENYEFRIFLKGNADDKELDEQFHRLHRELFAGYAAADAETAARCIAGVFRRKILHGMQSIWGLQKSSLLRDI